MAKEKKSAVKAATLAVSIALVAVFTTVVKIPTGGGGYLNCSDVAIAFVAYTLGPVTAFIAGGVGAAFADAIGGYAQWVPITFVAHGLEGLFMALILKEGKREFGKKEMWIRKLLAAVVCMVTVAGGYFLLAGTFLYGSWLNPQRRGEEGLSTGKESLLVIKTSLQKGCLYWQSFLVEYWGDIR